MAKAKTAFLAILLGALAAPSVVTADWEVAGWAGPTFPFYEQSFQFDPGPLAGPAGATVTQSGVYRLDGRGGIALGASLVFHPHPVAGLEARLDTADVNVSTGGVSYDIRATLPPPIGTLSTTVAFTEGEGDLERLRPVSLNVHLRSPGALRVTGSAGVSYLPGIRFVIRQPVAAAFGDGPLTEVGLVSLPAEVLPDQEGDGRWGWNAGAGVQWQAGPRVRLQVEGRYFRFQKQTLFWGEPEETGALTILQRVLVREITARLDPVRFNPTFFQATAGLAVSF